MFCCCAGALPPASRFQHWIVPSSQEEKTNEGRDRDQHPPVRLVWITSIHRRGNPILILTYSGSKESGIFHIY
jgi:hypothetical protein